MLLLVVDVVAVLMAFVALFFFPLQAFSFLFSFFFSLLLPESFVVSGPVLALSSLNKLI